MTDAVRDDVPVGASRQKTAGHACRKDTGHKKSGSDYYPASCELSAGIAGREMTLDLIS